MRITPREWKTMSREEKLFRLKIAAKKSAEKWTNIERSAMHATNHYHATSR